MGSVQAALVMVGLGIEGVEVVRAGAGAVGTGVVGWVTGAGDATQAGKYRATFWSKRSAVS